MNLYGVFMKNLKKIDGDPDKSFAFEGIDSKKHVKDIKILHAEDFGENREQLGDDANKKFIKDFLTKFHWRLEPVFNGLESVETYYRDKAGIQNYVFDFKLIDYLPIAFFDSDRTKGIDTEFMIQLNSGDWIGAEIHFAYFSPDYNPGRIFCTLYRNKEVEKYEKAIKRGWDNYFELLKEEHVNISRTMIDGCEGLIIRRKDFAFHKEEKQFLFGREADAFMNCLFDMMLELLP